MTLPWWGTAHVSVHRKAEMRRSKTTKHVYTPSMNVTFESSASAASRFPTVKATPSGSTPTTAQLGNARAIALTATPAPHPMSSTAAPGAASMLAIAPPPNAGITIGTSIPFVPACNGGG